MTGPRKTRRPARPPERSTVNTQGVKPPNLTPDGARRPGAFNAAKRASAIPTSQQPVSQGPNINRRGQVQPGRSYDFEVDTHAGKKTITIRDDANGHYFGPNDPQNRGPHFNDENGGHYDY
ncbi:hypothetical protein FJ958_29240 [Mesorhizobium sp. B2-3-5]|nr:hypothetical protein FJ958_29240 [Mesorhizobium sp. B2-3-5]